MNRILMISTTLAVLAAPVAAQDYRLKALPGADKVFVWKSKDAHNEGLSLIQAGAIQSNPMLVAVLLSCIAQPGAKVVMLDAGFATHDIMVIDGESSGCRGNIAAEALHR